MLNGHLIGAALQDGLWGRSDFEEVRRYPTAVIKLAPSAPSASGGNAKRPAPRNGESRPLPHPATERPDSNDGRPDSHLTAPPLRHAGGEVLGEVDLAEDGAPSGTLHHDHDLIVGDELAQAARCTVTMRPLGWEMTERSSRPKGMDADLVAIQGELDALFDVEDWKGVERLLLKSISRLPREHWLWVRLADAKYERMGYEGALECYEMAVSLN